MAALYKDSRSRLPGALQPGLEAVEGAVSSISTPVVQAMQLRSEQLLTTLDRKVGGEAWQAACLADRHC